VNFEVTLGLLLKKLSITENLPCGTIALCTLALACWPFISKNIKYKKKERKSERKHQCPPNTIHLVLGGKHHRRPLN
jgi:hypothetical protein